MGGFYCAKLRSAQTCPQWGRKDLVSAAPKSKDSVALGASKQRRIEGVGPYARCKAGVEFCYFAIATLSAAGFPGSGGGTDVPFASHSRPAPS